MSQKTKPTASTAKRARFRGEKRYGWTIQVKTDRYVILTKPAPFQTQGSVLYTICDTELGCRGPSNFIGNGWDMQTRGPYIGSRALHVALLSGEVEISRRSSVPFALDQIEVKP